MLLMPSSKIQIDSNNNKFYFFRNITFKDSGQDGFGLGAALSAITDNNFLWNRISTQSIILIIRCGGLPNFLTVAVNNN